VIKYLNFKNFNPASAYFDEQKLEWMNGEYIRNLSHSELKERLYEYDSTLRDLIEDTFGQSHEDLVLGLAQTRAKTLADFKKLIEAPQSVREYTEKEEKIASLLKSYMEGLENNIWSDKDQMLEKLKEFA